MKILDWYRHHFQWKYIGHRFVSSDVPVLYYMTESGRRKIVCDKIYDKSEREFFLKRTTFDRVWVKGGPFPHDFKEETSTLAAMLSRIVDKEMMLDEKKEKEAADVAYTGSRTRLKR